MMVEHSMRAAANWVQPEHHKVATDAIISDYPIIGYWIF